MLGKLLMLQRQIAAVKWGDRGLSEEESCFRLLTRPAD